MSATTQPVPPLTAEQAPEELAYTLGKQAYICGSPWRGGNPLRPQYV